MKEIHCAECDCINVEGSQQCWFCLASLENKPEPQAALFEEEAQ